jgi:hypothetical protein
MRTQQPQIGHYISETMAANPRCARPDIGARLAEWGRDGNSKFGNVSQWTGLQKSVYERLFANSIVAVDRARVAFGS